MDVWMPDQGLAPRVKDAQHADRGTEVAWICRDLTQGHCTRLEEPGVQTSAVPIGQGQHAMWEGEDDVHIRHVEQFPRARVEPALPCLRLTLRAMPVSARVIRDGLMPAGVTPIEMPAQRGRATARDRPQDRPLLDTQPRMPLDKGVTLRVEEIGHLHSGPAHDCGGFRRRRERGTTGGTVTCNCSSGMGAACRCRRDRWRYTVVCDRSVWPSSS
jgi:hypothetical protein